MMTSHSFSLPNGMIDTATTTLLVCGGGVKCPKTDNLTHDGIISPTGKFRCKPCARRLGWIE